MGGLIDSLGKVAKGIGRGAEDVLTLGGAEGARKWGGPKVNHALDDAATGMGANLMAGAAGGSAIMGGHALAGGSTVGAPPVPASAPAPATTVPGTSAWENHAGIGRDSYSRPGLGGSGYETEQPRQQQQIPLPPPPTMGHPLV